MHFDLHHSIILWLVLGRRTVGKVKGKSQDDGKDQADAKLKVEADWSNINLIQLQNDQGKDYGQGERDDVSSQIDRLAWFSPAPSHSGHSSMVEISPGSCPSSFALSTRRMILPDRVLGSDETISISDGTPIFPSSFKT